MKWLVMKWKMVNCTQQHDYCRKSTESIRNNFAANAFITSTSLKIQNQRPDCKNNKQGESLGVG